LESVLVATPREFESRILRKVPPVRRPLVFFPLLPAFSVGLVGD
jgi:hypothetical protein